MMTTMVESLKVGPVDVGQFLWGAAGVVCVLGLWVLFLLWVGRQIFGKDSDR